MGRGGGILVLIQIGSWSRGYGFNFRYLKTFIKGTCGSKNFLAGICSSKISLAGMLAVKKKLINKSIAYTAI